VQVDVGPADLLVEPVGQPDVQRPAQRREGGQGRLARRHGLRAAAGVEQRGREPALGGALPQPVAGPVPELPGPLGHLADVRPAVHKGQVGGARVVQLGPLRRRQVTGEAQRPLVLRRRLAVRRQLGRAAGGPHRVVQHRPGVADRLGVERHPASSSLPASRSAARIRAWIGPTRCSGTACSTASRVSSCRNVSRPPSPTSNPDDTSSSTAAGVASAAAASSTGSIRLPISAPVLSTARASSPTVATRASTTSRAEAGTAAEPDRTTSVTKNGLPPVSRCRSAGSMPLPPASRPTACTDRGARSIRRVPRWVARTPRAARSRSRPDRSSSR
jgi:hypothetical protein